MSVKTAGVGHFTIPTAPVGGTSCTSGAANTFTTTYVQLIASTAAAIYITGIYVEAAAVSAATYVVVQLATGGAGSETIVGQYLAAMVTASTVTHCYRPIFPPIPVATTTRIACKTADSVGSAATLITLECINQSNVVDDGIAVGTVTTVTNQLTAAAVAAGVWRDAVAADFTQSASVGLSVMNGVALGTGLTVNTVTNQLTAAAVAAGVWRDTVAGDFTVALSIGKSVMNGVTLGTGLTVNDLTTKTGYSITGTTTTFDALQTALNSTHGAGSWATATGFATPTNITAATGVSLAAGQKVDVDTIKTQAVATTGAGTITIPAAATLASTTNITSAAGVALAASQHVIVDSGTVTTLSNLPAIPAAWLTATGIAASALNGKGDWLLPAGTLARVTLVDTVTTYTGNTPQTGDSFARIGALGSGLTGLGDSRIANLDMTVSGVIGATASAVPSTLYNAQATEDYRANGASPTLGQFMSEVLAHLGEASISGTTKTINQLDHVTPAQTYTLDDATNPTSITRAT